MDEKDELREEYRDIVHTITEAIDFVDDFDSMLRETGLSLSQTRKNTLLTQVNELSEAIQKLRVE